MTRSESLVIEVARHLIAGYRVQLEHGYPREMTDEMVARLECLALAVAAYDRQAAGIRD